MPKKRDIYNETEDFEEDEDVPSEQDTYPPESEEYSSESSSEETSDEDESEEEEEQGETYGDGIYENEDGDHFFIKDGLVFDSEGQLVTEGKKSRRRKK